MPRARVQVSLEVLAYALFDGEVEVIDVAACDRDPRCATLVIEGDQLPEPRMAELPEVRCTVTEVRDGDDVRREYIFDLAE